VSGRDGRRTDRRLTAPRAPPIPPTTRRARDAGLRVDRSPGTSDCSAARRSSPRPRCLERLVDVRRQSWTGFGAHHADSSVTQGPMGRLHREPNMRIRRSECRGIDKAGRLWLFGATRPARPRTLQRSWKWKHKLDVVAGATPRRGRRLDGRRASLRRAICAWARARGRNPPGNRSAGGNLCSSAARQGPRTQPKSETILWRWGRRPLDVDGG